MDGAIRDLWLPGLTAAALAASAIAGAVKLFTGPTVASPLAISVLWALYGLVPPFLVVFYATVSRGAALQAACRAGGGGGGGGARTARARPRFQPSLFPLPFSPSPGMFITFVAGAAAVFAMWGLFPARYEYEPVVAATQFALDAHRVGVLPAASSTPPPSNARWLGAPSFRASALLQEATSGPGETDLTGGWLAGGDGGNTKSTPATAFAVSLAAWSLVQFPAAHANAAPGGAATARAADAVRWGGDYLMKASATAGANGTTLVAQVGNWTADKLWWGRPEEIRGPRPALTVDVGAGAADLAATTAAALAAASVVWRERDLAWSIAAASRAAALFGQARAAPGLWARNVDPDGENLALQLAIAPSARLTTQYDKVLWAAAWLVRVKERGGRREEGKTRATSQPRPPHPLLSPQYRASGNDTYLLAASDAFVRHVYEEGGGAALAFTPDAYFFASNVLLANTTGM